MELNFIKDNNKYVSEFEVSSDFNLHIERNEGGTLYIQQRTGNGQYDTVKDAVFKLGDSVIDYDFQALVYPKYIKIVSDINPIAYITSDGEVTEIKSQTKEVEVTANGTTQVAPDAGYSYLTGVTVKTNVPQSGGSGGEGGENGNVLYLSPISSDDTYVAEIVYYARFAKVKNSIIAPPIYLQGFGHLTSLSDLNAIGIGLNDPFIVPNDPIGGGETIKDALNGTAEMLGQKNYEELLASHFRFITKEEFYSLEGGGITDKFVSIRELYQPTKEEVDLDAEPQLMNVENCDRVTEVKVNFATEYEDVGKDNNFILFDKANSTFMNVSIFTNQYVGMKCLFSIESAESGYSSYSPFAVTSEGTITTDENAVKEINSILANGDFRYIALGNVMNLTDAEFDIIDKFIKVKTV